MEKIEPKWYPDYENQLRKELNNGDMYICCGYFYDDEFYWDGIKLHKEFFDEAIEENELTDRFVKIIRDLIKTYIDSSEMIRVSQMDRESYIRYLKKKEAK